MKKYRITKYDPKNRNDQGHYLYDHWTEITDVGKTLEGELVTQEEYFRVEKDYINAVVEILKDSKQQHLRLVGFDQKKYQESILDHSKKWFHESSFENLALFEGKEIILKDIPTLIKLNLRGYIYASLEIINQFYVQFGYDFYMYVGVPDLAPDVIEKLNATSIFVEEYWSPYYYPKLKYVIEFNKKDSVYLEDEEIVHSFTIEKMKAVFGLSQEHPGRIYQEIDREIAEKLGVEVDFDKYEYQLSTQLEFD